MSGRTLKKKKINVNEQGVTVGGAREEDGVGRVGGLHTVIIDL